MHLRGGPFSGQVVTADIEDAANPPEVYTASVHGPHETAGSYEYRLAGRGPDNLVDADTWIYEASTPPP